MDMNIEHELFQASHYSSLQPLKKAFAKLLACYCWQQKFRSYLDGNKVVLCLFAAIYGPPDVCSPDLLTLRKKL